MDRIAILAAVTATALGLYAFGEVPPSLASGTPAVAGKRDAEEPKPRPAQQINLHFQLDNNTEALITVWPSPSSRIDHLSVLLGGKVYQVRGGELRSIKDPIIDKMMVTFERAPGETDLTILIPYAQTVREDPQLPPKIVLVVVRNMQSHTIIE